MVLKKIDFAQFIEHPLVKRIKVKIQTNNTKTTPHKKSKKKKNTQKQTKDVATDDISELVKNTVVHKIKCDKSKRTLQSDKRTVLVNP